MCIRDRVWNASRFVLMNIEDYEADKGEVKLTLADKWILEELRTATAAITENFRHYELGEAARAVYDFAWDSFCDWYIEMVKPRLYGEDPTEKYTAQTVLIKVLSSTCLLYTSYLRFNQRVRRL